MGKEGFIIELTNKSEKEAIKEIKRIYKGGDLEKLTVKLRYKQRNSSKENSYADFQFLSLKGSQRNWREDEFSGSQFSSQNMVEKINVEDISIIEASIKNYEEGNIEEALDQLLPLQQELQTKIREGKQTAKTMEDFPLVTFYIGNCYYREKQYDKAIQYYEKQSGNDTRQKGQRMNNLGTCFAMKQEQQLSLKAFNQALKAYSKHPEINCSGLYNNIGLIYLKSSMFSNAIEYFNESIKERPKESKLNKLYFSKGMCLKEMKKYDESINCFSLILNSNREGSVSNNLNVLKQISNIYELQEKWDQALKYYEKMSDEYERKNQSQGYVYERVAKIHERMGNFQTCKKFEKKAFDEYRHDNNERKMSDLSNRLNR